MPVDRRIPISLLFGALSAVAAPAALAAGAVEVSFIEPARYSDAGKDLTEARRNEETLDHFLHNLGERYLGASQMLKIDVLDLDLAGTVRPSPRSGTELRIVRGAADVPRIRLRYSLSEGGTVVKTAEETVTDLNYARHPTDYSQSDPLRYEKRMLADWFKARFVNHKADAG
jgi:hypothetical protein